jgi:5'-nucleotidase
MNFLVVNDDGYLANGILLLQKALTRFGSVYVSAPFVEQSASSQKITLASEITIKRIKSSYQANGVIIVDGSPSDCIRIGLREWDDVDFDCVFSGVNQGTNLSYDTLYSGTLAAAKEASLYGISAIALSTDKISEETQDGLLIELTKLIEFILDNEIYKKFSLLNINIPSKNNLGIKVTSVGEHQQEPQYLKTSNKFILSGLVQNDNRQKESDYSYFNQGYITISPIKIDQTDNSQLDKLTKLINKIKGDNDATI